jgi:hypothetical protein
MKSFVAPIEGRLLFDPNPAQAPAAVRDVEFIEMPVRQILNRCDNPRLRFR